MKGDLLSSFPHPCLFSAARTWLEAKAGPVKFAFEQLQTNNGVNNDDKYHKQGNVKQRHHGSQNGVKNHLQTWNRK